MRIFKLNLTLISVILLFAFFTNSRPENISSSDSIQNSLRIDSFIKKAIKEINFKAGFSISVVKDNRVLFSSGYGYRDIDEKLPATANTPFYIASATKSFVALAAKMLADEGLLDLDLSISKYLPQLHLIAPMSSETISIRDLLTHRSGIENLPVVLRTAYTGDQTDSLVLSLLDSSIFKGHQFRYTNTGYVLTGIIIKKVTGKSWQDVIEGKIFGPLNMSSSHCRVSLYKEEDLAVPYSIINNRINKTWTMKDDNTMHAAGGIITTASDAASWLMFNINNGLFNDKQIISGRSAEEIHSAQISLQAKFYNYKRFAYGLGWYLSDYNGELLIHHFGGYSGFRSHVSFMPEYKTGVAAFVNDDAEGYYLPDLVADYVYNLLSGKKDFESIGEKELQEYKEQLIKMREKETLKEQAGKPSPLNIDEMNRLKGIYKNDQFGRLDISIDKGVLVVQMGSLEGEISKTSDGKLIMDLGAFNSKVDLKMQDGDDSVSGFTLSSIPWPDKSFKRMKE